MMPARFTSFPHRAWRTGLCRTGFATVLATLLTVGAAQADAPPAAAAQADAPPAAAAQADAAADTPPSASTRACCRSTDDFPWQDLPTPGKSADLVIDAASPSYLFHAGESPFLAFRLPAATAPYRIELRALPTPAADVPGGWRVFYPEAVLLTADHLVSRTAPAENLVLEPVGSELAPTGAYALFLPIDPATDNEKFLVVYTVGAKASPEATPQMLQARGAAVRAAGTWQAGASDTGRLRLTVVAADAR